MKTNNKQLILTKDNVDKKNEIIINSIEQFKQVQEQLKSYKELDKMLKEQFKKYDFQKVIIMSEQGNTTFTVTQYDQEKKSLNKERLIEVLEAYIKSDLALGDDIVDKQIPLKEELERILDEAYETNIVKCVKYGVK